MDPTHWYDAQTQQYYPYGHFPNPGPIPGGGGGGHTPAASTHFYGAPDTGAVTRPPGVDGQAAPNPYGPHGGYGGHAVPYVYPPVEAAHYYQGFGGGDGQVLLVTDANQQYGAHPVARGDVLGKPTSVTIYQNNKGKHPSQNDTKKKKKIPRVVQSMYCEVCKINCNSQEVLNSHRQGKKHKKNLEKLKESVAPNSAKTPTTSAEKKDTAEVEKDKTGGEKTKKNPVTTTKMDLDTKKRRVLEGGAAADSVRVCTICNVVCNSQVVFSCHIVGHKHTTMLKKHQGATGS
uniref:Zinc finger protein 385D n=1 Tax=Anthurium amnicola TaxID=1678845 RepID=A0A1D1XK77_9ARAE